MLHKNNALPVDAHALEHLLRHELLQRYEQHFPHPPFLSFPSLTRREIIDAIRANEPIAENWHNARGSHFQEHSTPYPFRRPSLDSDTTGKLVREDGQRLHWIWERDAIVSTTALLTRDWEAEVKVPAGVSDGDLLLTVVNADPALVIALDVKTDPEDTGTHVKETVRFQAPVLVRDIEQQLGSKLPRSTQQFADPAADAVLAGIRELLSNPQPIHLTAGACRTGDSPAPHTTLAVLSLLQNPNISEEVACYACGRTTMAQLEPHLFRPSAAALTMDIQEHVDDMALLCADCHVLCHRPSLEQLRGLTTPACPACQERNPRRIIWGMPAFPETSDVIHRGCALPLGPMARWNCRNCDTDYLVASSSDSPGEGW